MTTMIRLKSVEKRFGDRVVISPLSLEVEEGEFLTLLGPSGCGKTTLLRIIAGFETPTSGEVLLDGKPITHLPPYRRDMNMVFQHYALFPHMTVEDNIRFGMKMKKLPLDEQNRRLEEALEYTNLSEYRRRRPHELSGGQQQRVAVARAIVNKPRVLLLDEPLSALDYQLRRKLQVELKNLQRDLGITFVYVTHDQEEAMAMSDRIAVMNRGVIEQVGTPEEIYLRPRTLFVAMFVGENNLFRKGGTTVAVRPENIRVVPESALAEEERASRAAVEPVAVGAAAGAAAAGAAMGGAGAGAAAANGTAVAAVARGVSAVGMAANGAAAGVTAAGAVPGAPAAGRPAADGTADYGGAFGTVQDIVFVGGLRKTFVRVDADEPLVSGVLPLYDDAESVYPSGRDRRIVISCDTAGSRPPLRKGERVAIRWAPEHEVTLRC